ncbi:MAG: SMP-30/gluconolactonase/LRE family protein [Deltaproteobacteria bacterium]|nr:SMP-30/gluconolactonase/LRE family protein [Deltaproteobacteria bacterium]
MSPQVLTEGLQFPEGPVWAPDGTLYVTEIEGSRITAISPDGSKRTFAETGGAPNGAALGSDGYLYVTNNGGRSPGYIQRIDARGKVEKLYEHCDGQSFQGPNDLVMDVHGGFYFTDPGSLSRDGSKFGHLYYARRDGSLVKRMQYYFLLPNGIALTPDDSTLIVLESLTSRVWAIPIESPGVLAQVDAGARAGSPRSWPVSALLATVPQPAAPDGMCLDEAGNLLICAHNSGMVSVHAPNGAPLSQITVEDRRLTNCCFGGADFKTLYITESGRGRVVTIPWERPGLRLHDH